MPACQPAIRCTSSGRISPVFSQSRISMCHHSSVVLIKIYLLYHSESFHPLLLQFLFDWPVRTCKKSCNGFCLFWPASGQIHVNMIINEPTFKIINKCNVIAIYWLKSQTTSRGAWFHLLMCSWTIIQLVLKSLLSIWDVRCTASSNKLQHMYHFMFDQIELHTFKAVINDYSCFLV